MLPGFYYYFFLSYNTFILYILTKTRSTIAEAGAWTLGAYSWLCADMLVLREVTYCPQLSYYYDRCTWYLFQRMLRTRPPRALRSCKGWQCTKYKVFNNWEPDTEGQISCKGCTGLFFFLREDKQEIQKESLGLPSSVLLGDLYSEHLSQQFQFQAEHQFACKLQWGTAVHQAKKSKGGFSPGILGFYEALSGDSISGHWKHMETCRHVTALNKRKMVSLLNSSSLQTKGSANVPARYPGPNTSNSLEQTVML